MRITVHLPKRVLDALERERRARGQSRSEFIRRAVEAALPSTEPGTAGEREARYVRGYREQPESPEEAGAALAASRGSLAGEPWE